MTRLRRLTAWTAVAAAAILLTFPTRSLRAASACEFTGIERVVAVGDVHGAYDRYLEILRTAGVIGADGRWSGGATRLVQLGDMVDRGNDSRKVLDVVRRLEREAQTAGGRVHVLLGNHEVLRMLGDLRLTVPGEYEAFATADSESTRDKYVRSLRPASPSERNRVLQETPLGLFEMRLAFGRDGEYGRWLRQLPVTVTIDGLMFLHGGISPAVAALGSCDRINEQVRRDLTSDLDKTRTAPLASLVARADGPLWYRGLAEEPEPAFAPQLDEILQKLHARGIVVAHTVTPSGRVTTRFNGRVIQIDTGMQPLYVPNGRASALEIRRDEATAIYVDRRDAVSVPKRAGGSDQVRDPKARDKGNRRAR